MRRLCCLQSHSLRIFRQEKTIFSGREEGLLLLTQKAWQNLKAEDQALFKPANKVPIAIFKVFLLPNQCPNLNKRDPVEL